MLSFTHKIRALIAAAMVMGIASCSTYKTSFDAVLPADVTRGWHVADVQVNVPEKLRVSEAKTILPFADIVWREDPDGDRKAQVAKIMADATRAGAAGLTGSRPVVINLTMKRFHALTFEAERRLSKSGVHDIIFTATINDARTGAVLVGPDAIEASLPALSGDDMFQARLRGESQKSQITAHVSKVIAGWLGLGPDPRGVFRRLGD